MSIDIRAWNHQNLWLSEAGELEVRRGVYEELAVSSFASGEKFVHGFSLKSPNTGEVWHYLFTRNTTSGVGTAHVVDEDWNVLQTLGLGNIPSKVVITHATISSPHVSSLEMLIGGPDIPTLYGFVGGGLILAEKVEDDDPNTTAIDIPRGIVAGFAGRAVIANGKNIYISNAYGTSVVSGTATYTGPRTYVPINIGDLASIIYGLHVSSEGALIIVTDRGVWGLPPRAVAQGLQVRDLFEKLSTYEATDYQQTALSRSTVYGLSRVGVVKASRPDLPELELAEERIPLSIATPIDQQDFRGLRLWAWERGVAVSRDDATCLIDDRRGFRAWQMAPSGYDATVLGVLTEDNGNSLFVSPDRVWSFHGYEEDDASTVIGTAFGRLQVPPEGSLVVRGVTTSSDSPAQQWCSVRGGVQSLLAAALSKDTPQATDSDNDGSIIGTGKWAAAEPIRERELRSRRFRFAVRTDDPTLEVGAEHCGSRLGVVGVELKGQGRKRP